MCRTNFVQNCLDLFSFRTHIFLARILFFSGWSVALVLENIELSIEHAHRRQSYNSNIMSRENSNLPALVAFCMGNTYIKVSRDVS